MRKRRILSADDADERRWKRIEERSKTEREENRSTDDTDGHRWESDSSLVRFFICVHLCHLWIAFFVFIVCGLILFHLRPSASSADRTLRFSPHLADRSSPIGGRGAPMDFRLIRSCIQ